jgi:hypothetical protein
MDVPQFKQIALFAFESKKQKFDTVGVGGSGFWVAK